MEKIRDGKGDQQKLAFQPLLDIFDYLTVDSHIVARVEFIGEESHEVTVSAKVAICFYYFAAEGITNNLRGEIIQLTFFARAFCPRNPFYPRLFWLYPDRPHHPSA